MVRRVAWCVLAAGAAWALGARSASAGFQTVSQSVDLDVAAGRATFTLVFDQPPDFVTHDEFGRPANSFQYEIDPTCSGDITNCPPEDITAVVRGDEVRQTMPPPNGSGTLPIRAGFAPGSDPSPASGGWGPLRGSVPYQLRGDQITFSTSLDLLGADDHGFAYRVFTTEFGQTTSVATGNAGGMAAPVPGAFAPGLITFVLGLAATTRMRSRRTRSVGAGSSSS